MNKKDIEDQGLDPNYIAEQSEAISQEMEKKVFDPNYVMEKAENIVSFLKRLG